MEETSLAQIRSILNEQRIFFGTNQTKATDFRLLALKKLKQAIGKFEKQLTDALWKDLRKSYEEAYLTEISIVNQELDYHIKHLKKWAKPTKVSTPAHLLPSSSRIIHEPLGVALIIAPWNYPFQLLINPLVGAISAGCCAILKPSPDTPHVAKVLEAIIRDTFQENHVHVVQGGRETNEILLKQKFDLIFFTGSSAVGKVVMKAAAEHLTPVVLELGGKSPCIVDESADLEVAARRIIWGKTINAGQTCIAPDYLFVHEAIKEDLISKMEEAIESMFGENVQESKYYPRIVHEKAFDRLTNLMQEGRVRLGGITNAEDLYISPTVIDQVQPDHKLMQEEIFGPILPIITFVRVEEATAFINAQPKPLALYYFGDDEKGEAILSKTTSGGGCINDALMHISNHNLPFGGVGNSGIGKYHGKESFLAFSNQRAIVKTPTLIDLPFKYAPFKYFTFVKKIL